MTLKGEYSHNIDPKGRLIIPAKLRDGLGEHFVITKGMENCLYVYPEAEWNAFEEKLNALPTTTDKNARKFAYFFQGSATDGELDKQGRTLIPAVLRDYAMLGKEVVFMHIWIKKLYSSVWGSVPRYGTRPDGMRRMLKWKLILRISHLRWKQADSVSRGERYGIQTCISIIKRNH